MDKLKGKAVIAQGGGPTAVINQSCVGVALEARKHPFITHVYGARHGVRGIIEEDFLDLGQATVHNLNRVAATPSSALGSTRDKPDMDYCQRIVDVFRKHNIRFFFYIGGNDSAETCRIINDYAASVNYDLRLVHVPKTIDNDLLVTDHCPGYGSAGRYVATAFAGIDRDNHAIPGVFIGVVMGRHAGWLTASSVLARHYEGNGPHLIYVPERAFDTERFLADVDRVYKQNGRCVIAVSEGIVDVKGQPVILSMQHDVERDSFGNVQLSGSGMLGDALANEIKNKLKIKRVRCDTFGYIQRCFTATVSELDAIEARGVGESAVQFMQQGLPSGSVIIRRTGEYAVDYDMTSLASVGAGTKHMPDMFLEGDNNIADAFLKYARPLIGELPHFDRFNAPIVEHVN